MTPRPSRIPRLAPRLTSEISTSKSRIRDLERLLAESRRPTTRAFGPILTVAAANTPDPMKSLASLVCSGAADQEVIGEGMRILAAGGDLVLLSGDFHTDDVLNLFDSKARIVGSGRAGTVIHQTGTISFANLQEARDLTVLYEGDPAVGRYGIQADRIEGCTFQDLGAHAPRAMVDCLFAGTYAPGHGYVSGLNFLTSSIRYDRCSFTIQAPDDDLAYLPGNSARLIDCYFGNAAGAPGFGSNPEWLPSLARALVHLGNAPFDAPQSIIRGMISEISAFVGDEETPAYGMLEYGIRSGGDNFGSIVEGCSFQLVGTDPVGFGGLFAPFIAGLDYVDSKVTIRNNFGLGGLAPDADFFDYLPEQGYGI